MYNEEVDDATPARNKGENRLINHAFIPRFVRTKLQVVFRFARLVNAKAAEGNGLLIKLMGDMANLLGMSASDVPGALPFIINQSPQLDPDNPMMVGFPMRML